MVDACAWTSERGLVPRDQVEVLLSLLLKAEKRTWIANISPVNSSEHDDREPAPGEGQSRNCYSVDTGSLLLRHGCSIRGIHREFYALDPRHYCVKVTAEITNPDCSSSQMQVVSGDGVNRSGSGIISSLSSTSSQDSTIVRLTIKTPLFELYKNAVLCAQYPVLGASQAAASPYSPASSPFEPPLGSKRRGESSVSDNGHVSPEVCISTLSEELQELVQNVFGLGKRQHKFYCETEIPKQVPRSKEGPKFLVEELLSQQLVLEHNHHPFYRVQAFMDSNVYDDWLIDVKRRIDSLIKGIWQYSLPPVPELPLETPKYHEQYVELMKRLIRYESKQKELHPVYHEAVPIEPLSSPSCQLLKEFSLRYGVGILFCKLSYLEYIVKFFENNIWYIEHTKTSLRDAMNLISSGCQEIFVEEEFKMLLNILSILLNKTKYFLSKLRRIFPADNNPNEGVTALVTLFELTLESARELESEFPSVFKRLPQARQFSSNLSKAPVCDLLASFVENEIEGRYEGLKVKATTALGQNFSMSKLLLKSILEIHHEVSYYNSQYKQAFSRYFDIMKLSACKFYSLLMSDVEELCQNQPRNQRPDNVDCFMLCLAFRLSKLDKEWAEYIPYRSQRWRQPFLGFALQWLDATGHLLQALVPQLINHDLWEPVAVIIHRSHEQKRNVKTLPTSRLRSGSVPSLTPSSPSAFKTVAPSAGSPAKSSAAKGKAKSAKGKEPLPSGEKNRKRTLRVEYDSSSEEDGKTVKVQAQVNFPRTKVAFSVEKKILEPQNGQAEATSRKIPPAMNDPATQPLSGSEETKRSGEGNEQPSSTQDEDRPAQSFEKEESSVPINTQEHQENTIEVHSPKNGTETMDLQSSGSPANQSDLTDSHTNLSRNQGTPFENDSTNESDSENSIHTSDSFDFIEDRGKAKVPKKSQTKTVQPIEDANKSGTGRRGFSSIIDCQTCPARHSCFGSENDERSLGVRKSDPDKNKRSAHIPMPRNKRIDKLRPLGASYHSECGSFQSAHGSVFSESTEGSYRTPRSSPTPSQQGQSATQNEGDHHSDRITSRDDTPRWLAISSSFVDVIGAVNRLAAFACHLCEILCPDEGPQRSEQAAATAAGCSTAGDEDLGHESLEIKRSLYHRLVQVMLSFVKLYSDNVFAMDTCGLTDEILTDLLGERVQRLLRTQRDEGKLHGCRHNPLASQSCNTTDLQGARIPPCEGMSRMEVNLGGFEPLTRQMGIRLTNVAILRSTLPWLLEHVTSAITNPDLMEYDSCLSYCETGPSLDGISIGSTAEGIIDAPRATADALYHPGVLTNSVEHFCRLEISQVKLISYRINILFKQLLRTVLDLHLPRYDTKKRLIPAMKYLSRELQKFHDVLYPEDFNKILLNLWDHVVQNFEEECRRLVRRKSYASKQSHLLQQAVSYLMQFFYDGGDGIAFDDFATPMDSVVKHLQLYTTSTDRLISMYRSFNRQVLNMRQQNRNEELTSSMSTSSRLADANAPADSFIQAMRKDLHTSRKCFSGAVLVEWVVNYVLNHGYDELGLCIGDTETQTGLELGQYLLRHRVMICVCPPPHLNRQLSTERTREQQNFEENAPSERGKVLLDDNYLPHIKVNDISTLSNGGSPTSLSSSRSRTTSSEVGADDGYENDDEDSVGSARDIMDRSYSAQSENDSPKFHNHPKALYKFISEEDSSRTEVKFTLGFTDRLKLPNELKHILRVLYTRKNSDKTARSFLRELPPGYMEEALGSDLLVFWSSGSPISAFC